MNNKIITTLLLLALVVIFIISYLYIPRSFELEGGSCNQGITSMIIRFLLEICGLLSVISLIAHYFSKFQLAKALSTISVLIWLVWSLFFLSNTFSYFIPFLVITVIIGWWSFRAGKRAKSTKTPN